VTGTGNALAAAKGKPADRLEDMTPRLSTLRDRTGDAEPGRPPKPPFASSAKPPGDDPRDIVVASRNFR